MSQIETDSEGNFTYQKTLDGTYRPNYSVEVRDGGNNTVATTTFTDSDSSNKIDICHWDNGGGGKWNPQSVSKDSTDAQGHDDHDNDIIPPYHYDFTQGRTHCNKNNEFSREQSRCEEKLSD